MGTENAVELPPPSRFAPYSLTRYIDAVTFVPKGPRKPARFRIRIMTDGVRRVQTFATRLEADRARNQLRARMFSAWYAANAERNRRTGVVWRATSRGRKKETDAAWRAANRERRGKTYAVWCAANIDSKRRKNRAWARAHLEVARTNCSLRRARERGNGGSHSSTEFRMLCVVSGWLCRYCGIKIEPKGRGYLAPVRDHVEPLARGGSNAISNLVLSCFPCNLRKGNFSLAEFLERRARSAKNGTRAGA